MYAARLGSIECVEWFLSDAPLEHYLEFGKSEAAMKMESINHLEKAGGFDQAVTRWFGSCSEYPSASITTMCADN